MWSSEALWRKALLFTRRAMEVEDRSETLFTFWCSLSLELLARSALAHIHPSLLADSRNNDDNILFAFDLTPVKAPKSIPTNVMLRRCHLVFKDFIERDYKFSIMFLEKRNEELHTGANPFENWGHNKWLSDYYRVCQILLRSIDKELKDMFGKEETAVIERVLKAVLENKRDESYKEIQLRKDEFNKLPVVERLEKIKNSVNLRNRDYGARLRGKLIKCPACEGAAIIVGELIRSFTPRDEDGELVQRDLYLPERLQCYSCGLSLEGYDHLQCIELGETFQKKDILDPVEYYNIDPAEYFEPDEDLERY